MTLKGNETMNLPTPPSHLVGLKLYFIVGNPGLCDQGEPIPFTIMLGYPERSRAVNMAMEALRMMNSLHPEAGAVMQFKVVEMQFDAFGILVPTGNDEIFSHKSVKPEHAPVGNMPPAKA